MSCCKLRTPWPIHFKFHRVIGIDGHTVCILYGEILNFHSRVMGFYSSNCRRFFVCRAVNWEPLANSLQTSHSYWNWWSYGLYTFWSNLDFSFKSYGKESLYKYCMNVDDGRIMRSWRSCLLFFVFISNPTWEGFLYFVFIFSGLKT